MAELSKVWIVRNNKIIVLNAIHITFYLRWSPGEFEYVEAIVERSGNSRTSSSRRVAPPSIAWCIGIDHLEVILEPVHGGTHLLVGDIVLPIVFESSFKNIDLP